MRKQSRSYSSSVRRRRAAARRHFRPVVETLENRRVLAQGIFTDDFSSDADPTQPGFDTAADGFQIAHQFNGPGPNLFLDVSNIPPGPGGDFFSVPHCLFLNAIDRITFPDMAADEFINLARINVSFGARGNHVRFIARDGRALTVIPEERFGVQGIIATSQSLADDGQPLGQIVEMEVRGVELLIDDVRVLVTRNFAPEPQDDFVTASTREVIAIPVLANDLSSNFDPLTITAVTIPPHGQVEIDGATILYVSDQGFQGVDTFEYTVRDTLGETATATVYIQIIGPEAVDDRALTSPGVPVEIDVLENDTTPGDDDLLTIIGTSDPAGGVAAIVGNRVVYTPDAGFSGSDTFTYTLRDPFRNESTATVRVVVNSPPQAADLAYTLAHGITGPLTIPAPGLFAGASDPDGPAPAIVPTTVLLPFGSVAIAADGSFTVSSTRSDGRILPATFAYRVRDEFGFEAVGEVQIVVQNALPVAVNPSLNEVRGSAVTFAGTLGYDEDGDPLRVELVAPPAHGLATFYPLGPAADGRSSVYFEYVPAGGLKFNDRFTYRLLDPYGAALGTFEIHTNNAAALAEDDNLSVVRNVRSALRVINNDSFFDDDPLSYIIGQGPSHGTASVSPDGAILFYQPDQGFEGADAFTYRLTDGDLASNEATVLLTVVGIAQATVADDTYVFRYQANPIVPRTVLDLTDPSPLSNDFVPPDNANIVYRPTIVAEHAFSPADVDVLTGDLFRLNYPRGFIGSFTLAYGIEAAVGSPPIFIGASNHSLLTIHIIDHDSDGDGVNDSVEDDFGDATNFGEAINSPARVALASAVDGQAIWLQTDSNLQFRNVHAVFDPGLGAPPPADFPAGSVAFELHNVAPGGSATVTMRLPAGTPVNTFYKFGVELTDDPLTPLDERAVDHWYEFLFDGTTGAQISGRTITLHLVDNGRGDADPRPGIIADPGGPAFVEPSFPRVESVEINDGHAQRSKINSLTVTFDGLVTIDPGAFELRRMGMNRPIDLTVALSEMDGRSVALLTFKGAGVQHGSLKDGNYTLTIRAIKIRDASGNLLDGDGDGQEGGNYVDEFFRRFGDTDGDGDVDKADKAVFKSAFGKRSNQPGYLWYLDFNANGRIWAEDAALFLLGYCGSNQRR
jgi:hypothetical protein